MDLDAFRWLLTEPGQALLARAARAVRRARRRPGAGRRPPCAARAPTPAHAAAALTQVELRRRAVPKFGDDAARMYFTPDGPRAGHPRPGRRAPRGPGRAGGAGRRRCSTSAAASAATWSRSRAAGLTVAGIDRDALRRRGGPRQPRRPSGSAARCRSPTPRTSTSRVRRGLRRPRPSHGAGAGVRRRRLVAAVAVRADAAATRPSCVKVAPGIPHELVPDGVEAEWVSDDGEVKEAALWSPRARHHRPARHRDPRRRAGHADRRGRPGRRGAGPVGRVPLRARRRGDPGRPGDGASPPGSAAACSTSTSPTSPADERVPRRRSPGPTRCSRSCPFREKPLRAALRERGVGRLTIKKRGVDVVPEELRKRLCAAPATQEATLVLTRVAGQRHRAARPARCAESRPGNPSRPAAPRASDPRRMVSTEQLLGFGVAAFVLIVIPGPERGVHGRPGAGLRPRGRAGDRARQLARPAGRAGARRVRARRRGAASRSRCSRCSSCSARRTSSTSACRRSGTAARSTSPIRRSRLPLPLPTALRQGFVVGVSNPKAFMIFAAVLPQFVDRGAGPRAGADALLGLLAFAIGLCSDTVWALLASRLRTWFGASRAARRGDRDRRRGLDDRARRRAGGHRPAAVTPQPLRPRGGRSPAACRPPR